MFAPPNQNGMGGPPGGPNHSPYHIPPHYHQQPAPRQRTAIACRYCRRRKIRCSGFETSPDGRCANCMRFNQECVFTPVSSQPGAIQAFVPAHPHLLAQQQQGGRSTQLYGAQGQPLPASFEPSGVYHQLPPPPAHDSRVYGHPPPPPPPPSHLNGGPSYVNRDDRSHGPPPPPPPAGHPQGSYGRRNSGDEYSSHYANQPPSPSSHLPAPGSYPNPSINGSSSTYSASNFGHGQSPPTQLAAVSGSYYPSLPNPAGSQRPDSPGSRRSSGEPSVSPQPHATFHPPMVYPPRETSSGPSSPGGPIPSMQIAGLIDPQPPNPQHHQRSAADGDMLNRLNFRTGL
ncbi:hypothetical protein BDD12DRAFT_881169 [Trichophaea hybrida]|nr:hypothetical protein BDD12DRAFT_881169 [Trichophaea hybrida]